MTNSEVGDAGCTRAMRGSDAMTVVAGALSCSSRPEPASTTTGRGVSAGRRGAVSVLCAGLVEGIRGTAPGALAGAWAQALPPATSAVASTAAWLAAKRLIKTHLLLS